MRQLTFKRITLGVTSAIRKRLRCVDSSHSKALPIAALCCILLFSSIASAQGARLFNYSSATPNTQALGVKENSRLAQIKALETTVSVTFIQIDAAALNNNILQIPLPNGTTLTLINTLRETPFPGVNTWAGEGRDGFSHGTFASNQETGNVTGRISVGSQNYCIDPYGNKAHVLVDVDTSKLPPMHAPDSPDNGSGKR